MFLRVPKRFALRLSRRLSVAWGGPWFALVMFKNRDFV